MDDTYSSLSICERGTVGQISYSTFVWEIPRLNEMIDHKNHYQLNSPSFLFEGNDWFLSCFKIQKESGAVSHFRLRRSSAFPDEPCTQTYRLSVKLANGDYYWTSKARDEFTEDYLFLGRLHDLLESSIHRDSDLIRNGDLLSLHLTFYPMGKRLSRRGTENLCQNLKDLLLSGYKSDLTLIVKASEFKVHQSILAARSPVFSSLFRQEVSEQTNVTVQLTDCDVDIFQEFLVYLYSGRMETLNEKTVDEVFAIAKKYNVKSLAAECVDFMLSNLTIDSFCDTVLFALRHRELELLESVNWFMAENFKQMTTTEVWRDFTIRNPAEAIDILTKALAKVKLFQVRNKTQE